MKIGELEANKLRLFSERARELANHSMIREKKYDVAINLRGEQGEPVQITETAPDRESLESLLTRVRQFYSDGEPIHFMHIYNIVWRLLYQENPQLREALSSAANAYKEITTKTRLNLVVNEHKLTAVEIIDLWLNANVFHSDLKKVKLFKSLESTPMVFFINLEFRSFVVNLTMLVIWFGSLIELEILSKCDDK